MQKCGGVPLPLNAGADPSVRGILTAMAEIGQADGSLIVRLAVAAEKAYDAPYKKTDARKIIALGTHSQDFQLDVTRFGSSGCVGSRLDAIIANRTVRL